MNETIFHLDNNGNLTELNEANYISEDLLQEQKFIDICNWFVAELKNQQLK